MGRSTDRRGISPVVGVALMVFILALLGGITGYMFLSLGDQLSEPAPVFVSESELQLDIANGSLENQELVLVHRGGESVPIADLELIVRSGGQEFTFDAASTGDVADGTWSVGDELPIPLDTEQICTGASALDVNIVYHGESSFVVGEKSVPMAAGGFTIQNGAVVPVSDYTANATVLGAGFTYGDGGPNIDIRLTIQIGNSTYEPWPGNINNEGNPRTHLFSDQPAGAGISVAATGDQQGIYISPRTRWSNATNGWVHVLRDGDTPPNLAGFGDQDSASAYVGPYLDENGAIDLPDNQAIYLFELGNSQTGAAADFQDVVVLVTLQTEQQTAVVQQHTTQETVVICPES